MDRLEEGPESFAIWPSTKKREYPYRRINVGNYTVWYVVIDNIMEIRRIQPSSRNEKKLFVIKRPQAKNLRPTNLK